MTPAPDPRATVLTAWQTSNRVTVDLVRQIPPALWGAKIPGIPQRSIRMIAAHLHNARGRWIKTLGREHGIPAPVRVDHFRVSRSQLVTALHRSNRGMEALFRLGLANGGVVPPSKGYVWQNLPLDVEHVLAYFVAHEGHHRGQIVLAARQLGQRLPHKVTDGLWMWITRRPAPQVAKPGRPM